MEGKYKLLDLFCGAGGAAMGYHRAGFEVVGVDHKTQKHYPFEFHLADAFDFLSAHGQEFDVIHASPPCQKYSRRCKHLSTREHPELAEETRRKLLRIRKPYVIENVAGAPLINPISLCGAMFDLKLYRHRFFECSHWLERPIHKPHLIPASKAGHYKPETIISVAGNCAPISLAREAMGIDWMTQQEIKEAIPPAYTEWIGRQLIKILDEEPVLFKEVWDK